MKRAIISPCGPLGGTTSLQHLAAPCCSTSGASPIPPRLVPIFSSSIVEAPPLDSSNQILPHDPVYRLIQNFSVLHRRLPHHPLEAIPALLQHPPRRRVPRKRPREQPSVTEHRERVPRHRRD